MSDDGFINPRTGKYVSSMRAHQHVGESISGYEKAISKSTGNFYMRPTASVGSFGLSNPFLEMQVAALEAKAMQTYASLYVDAMNSVIESLNEMTRDMEIDNAEREIRRTYESALKNISSFEVTDSLQDSGGALDALIALIPDDQIELFKVAGNLDGLKKNCQYVLRVLDKSKSKLRDLKWKKDSSIEKDEVKEKAREQYYRLDSIRSSRLEAFKAMRRSSASAKDRESAIETFWQAIDAELSIVDEAAWKQKKYDEACLLADYGAFEQSIEVLRFLDDYPGAAEKYLEVANALEEFENAEKYDKAEQLLAEGKYKQAMKAFRGLGNWRDAKERLAYAESRYELWREETYCYAVKQFDDEEYSEASKSFGKLGNYLDSKERAKESERFAQLASDYDEAVAFEASGSFDRARDAFAKLGQFRDSSVRAESCRTKFEEHQKKLYEAASRDLANGDYASCIKPFEELGDYLDSKDLLEKAQLLLKQTNAIKRAVGHFKSGRFPQAKAEVTKPFMLEVPDAQKMLKTIEEIEQAESQRSSFAQKEKSAAKERDSRKKEYNRVAKKRRPKVAAQVSLEKTEERISLLETQLENAGFFAFGEKKRLRSELEEERSKLPQLKERISKERAQQEADVAANLRTIQVSIDKAEQDLQAARKAQNKLYEQLKSLKSRY